MHDVDNIARTRQDYSHYRIMLRDLRRSEQSCGDDSKIAYLIQVRMKGKAYLQDRMSVLLWLKIVKLPIQYLIKNDFRAFSK